MPQKINRIIARETPDTDPSFHEVLNVQLDPGSKLLTIWQKGRRLRLKIRYQEIFRQAIMIQARATVAASRR